MRTRHHHRVAGVSSSSKVLFYVTGWRDGGRGKYEVRVSAKTYVMETEAVDGHDNETVATAVK